MRTPVDSQARARLRDAQQAEARAVADVERTERRLTRQRELVATRVSALDSTVIAVAEEVKAARQHLVSISGFNRAAGLLGMTTIDLKRALKPLTKTRRKEADTEG